MRCKQKSRHLRIIDSETSPHLLANKSPNQFYYLRPQQPDKKYFNQLNEKACYRKGLSPTENPKPAEAIPKNGFRTQKTSKGAVRDLLRKLRARNPL